MVTLIVYDLKADEAYVATKRRFYYKVSKWAKEGYVEWLTKSVLLVKDENKLSEITQFIRSLHPHVEAYEVAAVNIRSL